MMEITCRNCAIRKEKYNILYIARACKYILYTLFVYLCPNGLPLRTRYNLLLHLIVDTPFNCFTCSNHPSTGVPLICPLTVKQLYVLVAVWAAYRHIGSQLRSPTTARSRLCGSNCPCSEINSELSSPILCD